MKLSKRWLEEYIKLDDLSNEELSEIITMRICEVEKIIPFLPHLKDIIIAEVKDVQPHPDADKLVVCKVYNGTEDIQIVTGATNTYAGKKYPLAGVGVTLPGGMTMKKAKLRGIESSGMLCSNGELDMEDFVFCPEDLEVEKAIMTLPDDAPVGKTMAEGYDLEDTIFDIDNKSITHRPDLWSHFGFARELSAVLDRPLKKNILDDEFPVDPSVKQTIPIEIMDGAAIGYCGAILKNVKTDYSSIRIQKRLIAGGMRPINNIVDVSNYVMLDIGQPNHAFDKNQIKGSVKISYSADGEKITTLDSKEHTLPEKISLIRDGDTPIAVGGIMGGENTEVTNDTTEVFLECANFHREDIRRGVSKLGIRSEASQRFEKGQDPSLTVPAIHRFGTLLQETCPDLILGEIKSVFSEETRSNIINMSFDYIRQRLGKKDLTNEIIQSVLKRLNIQITLKGDTHFELIIPSYRSYYDITIADDVVEEIGRLLGYNSIEPTPVLVSCEVPAFRNKSRESEHRIRNILSNRYGYTEIYNYAFHSDFQIESDSRFSENAVALANSVHRDAANMRISPLPGLLTSVAKNIKKNPSLKVYEIERIFLPTETGKLPNEKVFIAGMIAGKSLKTNPDEALDSLQVEMADFLDLMGIDRYTQNYERMDESRERIFHPNRSGIIKNIKGVSLLWGMLHPKILNDYGITNPLLYWEVFLDDLNQYDPFASRYVPPFRYPAAEYDLTILMDKGTDFAELLQVTGTPEKTNPDKTYIYDIIHRSTFSGVSVPEGKKAVSVTIVLRNLNKTIEGDELKKHMDSLIRKLNHFGYSLR